MTVEHDNVFKVLEDGLSETKLGQLVQERDTEIARLQDVILRLREGRDWDTKGETRYTAVME